MREAEILSGVAGDGHRRPNPFENLRSRALVPLVIFATLVLLAVFYVVGVLTPLNERDPQVFEVSVQFALYGAIALSVAWVCARRGVGLRRLVGTWPRGYDRRAWLRLASLLAVTMAFSFGSALVSLYVLSILNPGLLEFLVEALSTAPDATVGYRLAMAVIIVILAPVLEETLFRGILINRWGTRWGVPAAVIASSIAFGILHANPVGIGMAGLVMALLYLKTGTLIVPILFHAANNLLPTLAAFLFDEGAPLDVAAEIRTVREDVFIGVVLVAVSLPILVGYLRRHWPRRDAALPYMDAEQGPQ
jgi:hypothetical protein